MLRLKKTLVLKIDPKRPDKKLIARAAGVLRAGGLVAFPTETVYGLGANVFDKKAIDRLKKVKARPEGKPFTVHIASIAAIRTMECVLGAKSRMLVARYWPGPLTVILPRKGGGSTGFRMPDNRVALELIKESAVPIVAPSANISGGVPPTDAPAVLKQLDGKIDILIDAGPADVGVESTVVDMTSDEPNILRQGAISKEDILRAVYG